MFNPSSLLLLWASLMLLNPGASEDRPKIFWTAIIVGAGADPFSSSIILGEGIYPSSFSPAIRAKSFFLLNLKNRIGYLLLCSYDDRMILYVIQDLFIRKQKIRLIFPSVEV